MISTELARWSLIALHHVNGVGWHTIQKCYQAGWKPGKSFTKAIIKRLEEMSVSAKVLQRMVQSQSLDAIHQLKRELKSQNIGTITMLDEDYPLLLKEIAQPPWVLYFRGRIELLQKPILAVIGSRRPSPYGQKTTRQLVPDLVAAGYVIISGMAFGIDTTAHVATMKAGGETIAVLGSGINVVYPKSNRRIYQEIARSGLILSEMPLNTQPCPGVFPQRNRIISGLSMGCVVIEAGEKSGTLITADFALEEGREVFAVPGPIDAPQSRGTLKLIKQGAKCVTSASDILEEFSTTLPVSPPDDQQKNKMDPLEDRILQQIAHQPLSLDELYEDLVEEYSFSEFQQAIFGLEMKGFITQLPGMKIQAK